MTEDIRPTWDLEKFRSLHAACYSARTNHQKGTTLESFVEYAFGCLEGLTLLARDVRMGAQELDLVFWNDQVCDYFRSSGPEILVECKNWQAPVGSAEAAWFVEKMRQRAITHGFLVTRSGVTGDFRDGRDGALDLLFSTLRDGLRPIVLTLDEFREVTDVAELPELFKAKTARLLVRRL